MLNATQPSFRHYGVVSGVIVLSSASQRVSDLGRDWDGVQPPKGESGEDYM